MSGWRKRRIASLVEQHIHRDYVDTLIERVGTDTSGRWISREAAYDLVRLAIEDYVGLDPSKQDMDELQEQFDNMFRLGN